METNINQAVDVIVKSDQTERTRYTPQYKREFLAAFESSSLHSSAPDNIGLFINRHLLNGA